MAHSTRRPALLLVGLGACDPMANAGTGSQPGGATGGGDTPPAEVTRWHRDHGYAFLVLSDHNTLTDPRTLSELTNSTFISDSRRGGHVGLRWRLRPRERTQPPDPRGAAAR